INPSGTRGKSYLCNSCCTGSVPAPSHPSSFYSVCTFPLSNTAFSALGRVGVANTRTRTTSLLGAESSDRGTDLHAGLGLQYDLTKNAAIRGEWERYRVKSFGDKNNTDLGTVGVVWKFY